MNEKRDPVDNALDLLRSQEWSAEPFGRELENRMMQPSNQTNGRRRFGKSALPLVVLAVFAVGGATFAATGGVERLRVWLLRIDIGGEVTEVEVDDTGQKTFTIETEDGGTAIVHVDKSVTPEDGERTEITVTQNTGGEEMVAAIDRIACVRREGGPGMPAPVSDELVDQILATEPLHTWGDGPGSQAALYVLPAAEGDGSRLFLSQTDAEGAVTWHMLAATPFPVVGDDRETTVDIDDDGMVTLTVNQGPDEAQVLKFKVLHRTGSPDETRPGLCGQEPLRIPGLGGKQITINIEEVEPEEDAE